MAIYEDILNNEMEFPVDIFIQDNLTEQIEVEEHWHDCFEILYMITGSAVQIINHRTFVAHQGDLILIKSGNIHSTYCRKDQDTKIFVLKFIPSVIDEGYLKLRGSKYIAAFLNTDAKNIVNLEIQEQKRLKNLLVTILDEFSYKPKAYEISVKGYIFVMISLLVRFQLITIPAQSINHDDLHRLDRILTYIEKNYAQDISLSDVAEILNMNYSYVSRYFKKITGKNFKSYLAYIRICEADKMILLKSGYIYQIALKCGFSNVQSFNRTYKRINGYSPGKSKK